MSPWPALVGALPLILLAAKTHGRALRLEREKKGYHHVEFGGDNPPEVEAMWKRDRYHFWILTIALVAVLAGIAWALRGGWTLPLLAPALAFGALAARSGIAKSMGREDWAWLGGLCVAVVAWLALWALL